MLLSFYITVISYVLSPPRTLGIEDGNKSNKYIKKILSDETEPFGHH